MLNLETPPVSKARISVLVLSIAAAFIALCSIPVIAEASPESAREGIGIGTSIRNRPLSDEASVTRVGFARRAAAIRVAPQPGSRTKGRLRLRTGDGQALPYVALRIQTETPGRTWIKIRIPARPNGQVGWVPANALGSLRPVFGRLVVDRSNLSATFFGRRGQVRWRAPVGVGMPGRSTPRGYFWITERLRSSSGSAYGPFAFGTSAYASHPTDWPSSGVIGIYGTDQRGLIPGRPSQGSIRLRTRDIRTLARMLRIGTPVRIR